VIGEIEAEDEHADGKECDSGGRPRPSAQRRVLVMA
jgi:hypothetical protein